MRKLIKIVDLPHSQTVDFYEILPNYNTLYWEHLQNDEIVLGSGYCVNSTRDLAMQSVIENIANR